jgi:predicted NAD/FAD-binding protein
MALAQPLEDFLAQHQFGDAFRDGYLLPMIACIWSCPTEQMLRFPVGTLIRFCHNHGLIQVNHRPQWFTVAGGSRNYIRRIVAELTDARLETPVRAVRRLPSDSGQAGVMLETAAGAARFDDVVLACHPDQSLRLLADATPAERAVLGAIRYQPNRALLHTDAALLPQRRLAWAAWNYERGATDAAGQAPVCLHYLLNQLQPLPWKRPVVVSLNPLREPDPAQVHAEFEYDHPVFDLEAIAAQHRLPDIQGRSHVWFAGAWTRYGFHEDGLMSGNAVAQGLRECWAPAQHQRAGA